MADRFDDRDERNRGESSGAPGYWRESARGDFSGDWARDRSPRDLGDNYARERWGFRGRGPKNYRPADDRIAEEIHQRLTDDDELDASEVEVRVENGEVTLEGAVTSRRARRLAEDIVYDCRGVHDVQNRLRVERGDEQLQIGKASE